MNIRLSQQYRKRAAQNDLVDLAEAVLNGKGELLLGAIKLQGLAYDAELQERPPFDDKRLYSIVDDCCDLPIEPAFREKCSQDYLERSQQRTV